MSKDENASATNPMLYDPIPETETPGVTQNLMQFVAATISKSTLYIHITFIKQHQNNFRVTCL